MGYNCFPEKIKRCWIGGIPSFSSILSLILLIYQHHYDEGDPIRMSIPTCLIRGLNVDLHFFSRERLDLDQHGSSNYSDGAMLDGGFRAGRRFPCSGDPTDVVLGWIREGLETSMLGLISHR